MTAETGFETPLGCYSLQRLPLRRRELLRAWDAADEYVLTVLAQEKQLQQPRDILILNDSFGALAVALHEHRVWMQSDSVLAHDALRNNFAQNQLSTEQLHCLSSLEMPTVAPHLVVIKVPKTLALLGYQLHRLRTVLQPQSKVIVAGMTKTMPSKVWTLLEELLGNTHTLPARKKAKLIHVDFDPDLVVPANPYPSHYVLEGTDWRITNHANVFSRERLDIGTRFFLQHLPVPDPGAVIVDLGCGNGLLGLVTASRQVDVTIHCVDESYMALASAADNFARILGDVSKVTFVPATGLSDFSAESVDQVLCNPPFHQQHVVGDHLALDMFKDSYRVLKKGGELWVVGNRHLGYHKKLARIFRKVSLQASNRKFVILRAVK